MQNPQYYQHGQGPPYPQYAQYPQYPQAPPYATYPANTVNPGQGYAVYNQSYGQGSAFIVDGGSDRPSPDDGNIFDNKVIRRAFIRKVYTILSIQFTFGFSIIAIFAFVTVLRDWVRKNTWIIMVSCFIFLASYLVLACVESFRREVPKNYVCLAILTISMSVMAGTLSSLEKGEIVLFAFIATALVTITLTIFAIQTKVDFTLCSGMLFVATMIVFVFGLMTIFINIIFGYSKILHLVYSCVAALLFSWYLVYDTQQLVGGRRFSLSEEEYIFAAMQIFVDVMYIFIQLLQIFGILDT